MSDAVPTVSTAPPLLPLDGFTVGITGDRRADEQAELLRRRGADVMLGPTIDTRNLADSVELRAATLDVLERPPEVVVATTGLGVRSWFEAVDGMGLGDRLRATLASSRILARGPKAAGALITAGLEVHWLSPTEQTPDLLVHLAEADTIAGRGLSGLRVAVQRDGHPEPELAAALSSLGADVVDVPVYRWTLPADPLPAQRLLDALCDRQLDAVTFTSAPAFANLLTLADVADRREAVISALRDRVVVACVGPVCAEQAHLAGIGSVVQPARWRLGSMVKALADDLGGRARSLVAGELSLQVQGGLVITDGIEVRLPRREQLLLAELLHAGDSVVAKTDLARDVWGPGTDPHVVEVTVARLRQRLGPAGAVVHTVPRRGYRLAAEVTPLRT